MADREDQSDDDGDSDIFEVDSFGTCSGISSSTWSLSDSSEHTTSTDSTDNDHDLNSLGMNSSVHSLSSIQSDLSVQNISGSNQGTSLDSEPHNENNDNSELITTTNDLNCLSKKGISFNTEGPEADKKKDQSQNTVDSNILDESKNKDMQLSLTTSDLFAVPNNKGSQNIERNAGTTVKPRNSKEVTNDVNPMHPGAYDSVAPKQVVDIDIQDLSKICETTVENDKVEVQVPPADEANSQNEITDINLSDILHKSIDDDSKCKKIKLIVRDSAFENNLSSLDSADLGDTSDDIKIKSTARTISQLLEFVKDSYSDDELNKVISDVIEHKISAQVEPSLRHIIVAMAKFDVKKSMMVDSKYCMCII